MLEVDLPVNRDVPATTRAFAACLASAIEVPLPQLPLRAWELSVAVSRWRGWLAGRGLGLVPIARPSTFNWPGYWVAVVDGQEPGSTGDDGHAVVVLMFGTPSGVVLSPQDPDLLGRAATDLAVRQGYVIAGFDPAVPTSRDRPHLHGLVEALAVAEVATGPMQLVDRAYARAGQGLDGDRYAAKAGTFTPAGGGPGYDLTMIQAEMLDELVLPEQRRLPYADARRNVVTRGIDVNELVGRRFRIGDVECLGQRLCEPCSHLERLTAKGVLRGLIHRGGLRADVLTDGPILIGARIETVD